MTTNKPTEQEAPELILLPQVTAMLAREAYHYCADCKSHCRQLILTIEALKELNRAYTARVDPLTLHCSCGAACTREEYEQHRERGHDAAIGDQEKLKQIRERRARVENSDLDYATADTGTRCVGYIYEKGTGSKVAQMESLYDVMRGQFFANAAADIDFLLSLIDSQAELSHAARTPMGISIAESAATAMRDRCVEKVKALGAVWKGFGDQSSGYDEKYYYGKADAAEDIVKELKSLTLDTVNQKEQS